MMKYFNTYDCAKEAFEYHLQEYQATTLEPAQSQTRFDWPAESDSFLASLITHHHHSLPQPHLNLFEHGIQECDMLKNLLLGGR